ncbi:hypothetical protein [Staphylococcus equorum]|uniref:Uncharacterized protein n=1 Tax=Staphylococcus equorum TaxID=246432 RepID=A0A9X4LC16_9STAP|nr:hypothetical protein [Staphylococcus equorum]MDG0860358.1 hypothetical protein [Staphylococcus equorum]
MANYTLTETKKIFTTTENEAERFIGEMQNSYGTAITKKSITKKTKRTKEEEYDYYISFVEITHNTLKDLI